MVKVVQRGYLRRLSLLAGACAICLLLTSVRFPMVTRSGLGDSLPVRSRLVQSQSPTWFGCFSSRCLILGLCSHPNATVNIPSSPGIPCVSYPWTNASQSFAMAQDTTTYFRDLGNVTCFTEGTVTANISRDPDKCPCKPGWQGEFCSFPDEVIRSNLPNASMMNIKPRLRIAPRRIINAFPFNNEFEMLEARLAELYPVVDVFLILESNYTASGQPKALMLLDRLKAGYYKEYGCKIVHVLLDYFPPGAKTNGWLADNILRDHLAKQGLMKQLNNFRSDDIFLLTDADELPYQATLWFLRLHDGYPEPIGYFLRANVFGFFWRGAKQTVHVICGVTVGLLTQVFENKAIEIRSAPHYIKKHDINLHSYLKAHPGHNISLWSFGSKLDPAGWHCSWCCPEQCIRTKLISAQNGDFPRWGDYPAKTNVTYIAKLIENGTWFDNQTRFEALDDVKMDNFAPSYMLTHTARYRHILVNPYKR